MKKLLFTAALAGSIALNANAQITFQKTFGGTSSETGYSVRQTTDGGYIITGFAPNNNNDVLLIKTDANGDTLWAKRYGGTNDDRGYSVQQTTDGGYIVAGQTSSFGSPNTDVYLIKTNSNGDTLWTKAYRRANGNIGASVQQTSDGGYIVAGSSSSMGNYDVYLLKTNAAGDTLWTAIYGGTPADYGQSVQQTADGGYIVLGYTASFGAGNNDVYLIRTDANGDTLWTKTYGSTFNEIGYSVQQTADGGYLLCGKTTMATSGVSLTKTDGSGVVQWAKQYWGPMGTSGYEVRQTTDGGYIVAGEASGFGGGAMSDAFLMRTDASGDTLWSKIFGKIGGSVFEYGYSVRQTSDGGFIMAGNATSFSTSNGLYLIKTDANGISGTCHQLAAAPIVDDVTGTIITNSTNTTVGGFFITNVINPATIVGSGIAVNDLLISTSMTFTDVSCSGWTDGKAVVTVSGGIPLYTYTWSTGQSTMSNSVSDSISGDTAGTYTVEITDAAGCNAYDTVTINEPPVLTANGIFTNVLCNGDSTGAIDLTVSGGVSPYTYLWSPTGDTTQDISGFAAGVNYNIEIWDANGCYYNTVFTISEPAGPLSTAIATISATSCGSADGSASVSTAGGTSPYTYSWSSGGSDATDTALAAGDYTVTVTDTNGCTITDSATIGITVPMQFICLITVDSTSTKNVIVWEKPITTNIDSFRIYRELGTNNYLHIASVPYNTLSVYIDPDVNPQQTSYRYKMSALDTCGNESDTSGLHKTIHLIISKDINDNPVLNWTDYEGFPVTSYKILRDTTGLNQWQIIGTVGFGITSFTDLSSAQNSRYVVEVGSPDTCTATNKADDYNSSRSNTSISVTGIEVEFGAGSLEFRVYPNPSKGVFTVEIMNDEYRMMNTECRIYNVLGMEISKFIVQNSTFYIDLKDHPAGIYHLQLVTDTGIANMKVVIE